MGSSKGTIPEELRRLKLCYVLSDCGKGVVGNYRVSTASDIEVYDDVSLGYSNWQESRTGRTDVLRIINPNSKRVVLLPLDNCIISGAATKRGGVADCSLLTSEVMSFVEFKTNVVSKSERNLTKRTEYAIKQLWNTYDVIIRPRFEKKGVDITSLVKVDFYIVFNSALEVTGAMASRMEQRMAFMNATSFPLFFGNEKVI